MMQIPLKAKYLNAMKGRFSGGEKPAPKKHRNKIGHAKHIAMFGEPPTVTLVVDGLTGKGVYKKV